MEADGLAGKGNNSDAYSFQQWAGPRRQRMWAKVRPFPPAVCEAHLAKIVKVDLKGELFAYTVDEAAKAQAELMDGKLLLVTNVPDLKPQEVLSRYKALADIERGFQVLKSAKTEISPEQALAQLRRIQRHSVSINRAAPMTGVSTVNTEQAKVLAALNVKKPETKAQMSLL